MLVSNKKLNSSGFTVVELLVAMTVGTFLMLAFLSSSTTYFTTISRADALDQMTVTSQNLLRTMVENIRYGDGILLNNQINDPNAPSGGWNTSNNNFVIILAVPAIDINKNYIIDSSTGSPYMNELVYYKSSSSLMERTLANTSASGNTLVTSCPPNLATNSCPADKTLATYSTSMSFIMYDQNGIVTTTTSLARSIDITLTMQQEGTLYPLIYTNSMRVTLRNSF